MDASTQPEIATIWNEARACTLQGDFDQAIDIYKYVLIRYEDNPVAMEYASAYLADTYLTLRQLDLAELPPFTSDPLNDRVTNEHTLNIHFVSTHEKVHCK
jgi:hypothetical protein